MRSILERRERRRHRHGGEPERSGDVDRSRTGTAGIRSQQRRDGLAVGEGFAPGAEVGLDTDQRPAAVARQSEAGTDVVDDQHGAGPVAQRPRACRVRRIGQCLILEGVMLERRRENRGEVVSRSRYGGLEACDVVVPVRADEGALLRHDAGRHRRAPRRSTVVRPRSDQASFASRSARAAVIAIVVASVPFFRTSPSRRG